jgi:hypothetical protein
MYKQIGTIALLALALTASGCGSSKPVTSNINGSWNASLNNTDGSSAFTFTTTFTQSSGTALTFTSFSFTTTSPCFSDQTAETGSFGFGGDFNGNVTGIFEMTITTIFPTTNNVLTLNGTVNGNQISGTWTLTGVTGCSGNGTFILNPVPAV